MPRPEHDFEGIEGDILDEIYEWPDVGLSSHSLTQRLNPNLQITAPEYRTAFAHVSNVIEEHIVRGLIRGKRSRNADGVFFNNLKLTYKGEQAAIGIRKRRTLPEGVEQLLAVVEEIKRKRGDR
ncbi:MAG: hypothetical protein ABSD70_20400 [Terracidiphilus sp.]|jgi:hypothetical protein